MNPKSLHALVIDRHFGELTPEAAELLEHHLAQNPKAREEAGRILQSVAVTGDTVLKHPELARVAPSPKAKLLWLPVAASTTWMMRAAAVALLAAGAAAAGFLLGRSESSGGGEKAILVAVARPVVESARSSPWARYHVSFDPSGSGMKVVRVDVSESQGKVLR